MKIHSCASCDFCISNNFIPVSGKGVKKPLIMFVGDVPSYTDTKVNSPFSGKSGKKLQFYIDLFKLQEYSYFTMAIKCKPDYNKIITFNDIKTCNNYLKAENIFYNPTIVVLLGNTAVSAYFNVDNYSIKKYVNNPFEYNNKLIYVNYHPSYIIKNPDAAINYLGMFTFLSYCIKILTSKK